MVAGPSRTLAYLDSSESPKLNHAVVVIGISLGSVVAAV